MANIPMDIITDLFLRLPASTLVRFRVLSKPLFSLIDSPDFISSHLNHTLQTGDHLMILLRGPRLLCTVNLHSPDKVSDVEHPLKSGGLTEVFGSCNGLIGLSNSPTDIAIFNPSTRQIHRLPAEIVDFPEGSTTRGYVFYGFGYDSANDDYKIVRMVQCKGGRADELVFGFPYEIKVFSLKRNSWKRIKRVLPAIQLLFYFYYHLLYRRGYGVLASNSLHWVLPRRPGLIGFNTIIRFDLASEEFEILDFPEVLAHENIDIGVLDGCLCLMCNHEFAYVDVWVMNVGESWSKLFRVTKPKSVDSFDFMRPLIWSKDRGKVLLEINNAKLVWFDLGSKRFRTVRIKDCDSSYSAELLVSSLVLGCRGDPDEVKRREERRAREDKMMQQSSKRDDFLSKGFKLVL
ncbi:unnamed protein product [Microthlaspi erraticum]|uniref:F-box domain-containing protein n=1 Tax=Microthlaspi erraticum TaxID=1685480 RepID=A0A6D2JZL1_9BRAS|nr:unnamed protein product [Microthlaspi erraticum]